MISNSLFYYDTPTIYPPFKNGLYIEEKFLSFFQKSNSITKRKYIPAFWTNFQIEKWFNEEKENMQKSLNEWIKNNPSKEGYFTIVQHDNGVMLKLPSNTIIFGCCSGDVSLPLIYEDTKNILENVDKIKFNDKSILCSFVGSITNNSNGGSNVRKTMNNAFANNKNFKIISGRWSVNINKTRQDTFINNTVNSKFALAPRGYGRSSFRFFEIFKLGTIPVYLWNDINWLPFQDKIDYNKLCITLNISEIDKLEEKLLSITEEEYKNMLLYYEIIKHFFYVDGCCEYIFRLLD